MDGTRLLQRFKDITFLEYVIPTLLGIACSTRMRVLARQNAALRDVITAVGLHGHPRRRHTVVPPDALLVMVRGAGMLGQITIVGNGIRTSHAQHANDVATQLSIAICLLWPYSWTNIPGR